MDDINIVNPLNEIKDIASHGGVFTNVVTLHLNARTIAIIRV